MTRRGLLKSGAAVLALMNFTGAAARAQADALDTPEAMIRAARARAAVPYSATQPSLVPPYDSLSYDSYRAIRPRHGAAASLPVGGEFRADLLPPGWLFPDPVTVQLPGQDNPIGFDPAMFDYDARYFPDAPPASDGPIAGMGFSGLRLSYPLNASDRLDDVLVLQGASYFRALARDTAYGLSARALALGTGGTAPEEFPVTRHITVFSADAQAVEFGCLIDSPRAAAALIATLRPGAADDPETRMDCSLHLFTREVVDDAGIAPLTSMFQHNDLGPARIDDFRPAVHDSDVLVIDNGAGERLWRPLSNPERVTLSSFVDDSPKRFGLLQSPVDFADFRDAEGQYHRRPSAMVEPQGNWGNGAVMLLEIPTIDEYADNIVAFWRPADPLVPGRLHRFDYALRWHPPGLDHLPPGAQDFPYLPVRAGSGIEPVSRDGRLFVLDFAPAHPGMTADPAALELDFGTVDGAAIDGQALYEISDMQGHLRASFVLIPDTDTQQAELRLRLRRRGTGALVAPVWLYRWDRGADGQP